MRNPQILLQGTESDATGHTAGSAQAALVVPGPAKQVWVVWWGVGWCMTLDTGWCGLVVVVCVGLRCAGGGAGRRSRLPGLAPDLASWRDRDRGGHGCVALHTVLA